MTMKKTTFKVLVGLLSLSAGVIQASAFQLWTQSATSIGYAHADMAALCDNASTAWYNPAGMARLSAPVVSLGGTFIDLTTEFNGRQVSNSFANYLINSNALSIPNKTLAPTPAFTFDVPMWIPRAQGDTTPKMPFAYGVYPLHFNCFDIAFGIAVATPFGLETNYAGSSVRNYAERSSLETVQINPSIAVRFLDTFSIGFGIGRQLAKSDYTASALDNGIGASVQRWEWTWNLGFLWEISDTTRFGVTYRPEVKHAQEGWVYIEDNTNNQKPATQSAATSDFKLPSTLIASFYHEICPRWSLLATLGWTRWSAIDTFQINTDLGEYTFELSGFFSTLNFTVNAENIRIPFYGKDSFLFALGSKVQVSEDWTARCGIAYDTTPVRSEYRELRLPDNDRLHVAFGLSYALGCNLVMDMGYQYVFLPLAHIKNNPTLLATPGDTIGTGSNAQPNLQAPADIAGFTGTSKSHANVFAFQLTWNFN
jgi:Long-chain fatty acid transport protein